MADQKYIITIMSSVHVSKRKVKAEFSPTDTIIDILNYYITICDVPGVGKEDYVLRNDLGTVLKKNHTLLKTIGSSSSNATFVFGVRDSSNAYKSDLKYIIWMCLIVGMMGQFITAFMYMGNAWFSRNAVSVINAFANGTELNLYNGIEEKFRCTINSTTGISNFVKELPNSSLKYYFSSSNCIKKSIGSSVFIGSTDGMREDLKIKPCETSRIMSRAHKILETWFPDVSSRIISSKEQGFYSWIALNYDSAKNYCIVLDIDPLSVRLTYLIKNKSGVKSIFIRNQGLVYPITKDYVCFGRKQGHLRYLISLLYEDYQRKGHIGKIIFDPCSGIVFSKSFESFFDSPCISKLVNSSFEREARKKVFHFHPNTGEYCNNKIRNMFSLCNDIFSDHCWNGSIPEGRCAAIKGGFTEIKDQLNLTHNPSAKQWNHGLVIACLNSSELCFEGHFAYHLLNKSCLFSIDRDWTLGYAYEQYSIDTSVDYLTTLSMPGFALFNALSTAFLLVGIFFVYAVCLMPEESLTYQRLGNYTSLLE